MKSWFYQVTCWFLVSLDSNHSQTFSSANFVCLCVCVLLPYYISSRPSVVVVTTWSVCVSFFFDLFRLWFIFFLIEYNFTQAKNFVSLLLLDMQDNVKLLCWVLSLDNVNNFSLNIVCLSVSIDWLIIGSKTIVAAVVHNWWTIKLIDEDH